jgi:hypothetical protein
MLKGEAGHWHGPVTKLGWLGPAQPHRQVGSNSKKKTFLQKQIISKICDFSKSFYCILINNGLYFYTVKIQIRY